VLYILLSLLGFRKTRDQEHFYGRDQDQAHRCQCRGLHRCTRQRAAARRLPGVDDYFPEDHTTTAKDVGAKHRWIRLLPVHIREWADRGGPVGCFRNPGSELGGLRDSRWGRAAVVAV